MIINKFGGASLKDANSIKHIAGICQRNISNGIIVVSAMGKTTNLLEKLTLKYFNQESFSAYFQQFTTFHNKLIAELFSLDNEIYSKFDLLCTKLKSYLESAPGIDYDFEYDQIVSYGEIASSLIFSSYLNSIGYNVEYVDIRESLLTDKRYRKAKILWEIVPKKVQQHFANLNTSIFITQGFIGGDIDNNTTTLGREGSDFTAAALAFMLNAEKVVVWKDVPGIMYADPEWMPNCEKIDRLSYHDAIELAFYGAKVIHPKTIKPLQNKRIPLEVKSFISPNSKGTVIDNDSTIDMPPAYIKKDDQVLVSIKPTDYSFIIEENMSHIFNILAENKLTVNLMQNSAVSFSIVVDNDLFRIKKAIKTLKETYFVKYNDRLTLITIRHHKPGAEQLVLNGRQIILNQHTRSVARYLLR